MGNRPGGCKCRRWFCVHSPWHRTSALCRQTWLCLGQPPAGPGPPQQRRLPGGLASNQQQGRGEVELQIGGRWPRGRSGVAVGAAEHLQPALAGPTLSQQLLARIEQKTTLPFSPLRPAVECRPDLLHPPARRGTGPKQEGTALNGSGRGQHRCQNGESLRINRQILWRLRGHPDRLFRNSTTSNPVHERLHFRHR